MLLLPNSNYQEENDDTLELEVGQIVYWECETSDGQNTDFIKSEVIAINEKWQKIQILPIKNESVIRVPLWVDPDQISLEEDTLFL